VLHSNIHHLSHRPIKVVFVVPVICMLLVCAAEISKHKGPPVFTEKERYKMVRAIKWVDEVCQ